MTKDILIIRASKLFYDYNLEDKNSLEQAMKEKFNGIFNVIIIYNENETNITEFEIIKY